MASSSQDFDINNDGTATLTLSGTPKVAVSGADAANFVVSVQPAATVAASGTSTFTVVFTPTSVGPHYATLSIANDDSDENPYTYSIQGTGVASAAAELSQLLERSMGMGQQVNITEKTMPFKILYAANSTATSFASKVPSITAPVVGDNGVFSPGNTKAKIAFFGTDADAEAGNVRILGWSKVSKDDFYIPVVIAETFLITFGTSPGLAGSDIDENQFFADTIGSVTGGHSDIKVLSPGNNLVGWIEIPTLGFQYIEVLFDRTTAASLNCVMAEL
tara:strand:- start:10670 stop:11497 length:828 start_codon:yes stop_codon:yes gene_type:complete